MAESLTFDGDVIVVTGGAGRLGRSQCLDLARRGARVVVNDLGSDRAGGTSDASRAQTVVDEIVAAGGEAVASTDSVASHDGPDQIVQTALDSFGRLDAFISNAAIVRNQVFQHMEDEDWDQVVDVNLRAVFRGLRSAYRVMMERGGRIVVMTSASGIAGAYGQANYAAAKMGVIGLVRTIAWEGRQYGIAANLVAPGARDAGPTAATFTADNPAYSNRPPELRLDPSVMAAPVGVTAAKVTPMVVRLVHPTCPVTGEIYTAAGGIYSRIAWACNDPVGIVGTTPSAEEVVDQWDEIRGPRLPREVDNDAIMWSLANFAAANADLERRSNGASGG